MAIPLKGEESMGASMEIEVNRRTVGKWIFDEAPPRLDGRRTADGVAITIPTLAFTPRIAWNSVRRGRTAEAVWNYERQPCHSAI